MPVVIAWIGEMLLSVVGQMALSALVAVGIGFLANKVVSGVIDHSQIAGYLANSGVAEWMGFFGVDKAITIYLSAWAGRRITDAARVHLALKAKSSS